MIWEGEDGEEVVGVVVVVVFDSAQIASLRNGWRQTRCDGSRLWSGEEKEDNGGDTCYRAAINPRDGTLYPQTLHQRGHCRHHSGLLASPRPSSKHLSLPCTPDPAPLQLALIKLDTIHLRLLHVCPSFYRLPELQNLNFIHGCMLRWEVTDNKALIYGDIYRCTRSPFIRSSLCCLTTGPHRRLHSKYDCAKSLHLKQNLTAQGAAGEGWNLQETELSHCCTSSRQSSGFPL